MNLRNSILLLASSLLIGQVLAEPKLRGIAETNTGKKYEGWIRVEGETLFLTELAGEVREIPAADLKVAHMHLVDAAANAAANRKRIAGLFGSYYRELNFGGPKPTVRVDPVIDFKWDAAAPLPNFPADRFSVRWEGEIETGARGVYAFHTASDDGVRLWVDGRKVVDQWVDQAEAEKTGSIELEGRRRYAIRLEYYDSSSTAVMHLRWTPPGGKKATIPAAAFSHLQVPVAGGAKSQKNGLLGTYYSGTKFEKRAFDRIDPGIKFDWSKQAPKAGFQREGFSVRWEGEVVGPLTGKVTFHALSDDGMRLWLGDRKLIDAWGGMAGTERRGGFQMEKGKRYPLRLEYYQAGGPAQVSLDWSGPSLKRQKIPAAQLFALAPEAKALVLPRHDIGLRLRGGSFLAGAVTKADAKSVRISCLDGKELRILSFYVEMIQLQPVNTKHLESMAGREPGCLQTNDEFVEADLNSIDGTGRVKSTSILFGALDHRPGLVRLFKVNKGNDPKAKFEVRTRSGSILRADSITLDGGKAEVKDNSRYLFKLDPGDVASVHGIALIERGEK